MHRILKPGGCLLILEFSKTDSELLKKFYDFYSFNVMPKLGGIIADDEDSYQYLAESIRKHPDQETLKSIKESSSYMIEKMKAKKNLERLYFDAAAKRKSFEKRFQAIQEELGAAGNELIPPIEMLHLYASKATNLNFTTPIGRLVGQTLEGYKSALFEERALKEDLNKLENSLSQHKKGFEN